MKPLLVTVLMVCLPWAAPVEGEQDAKKKKGADAFQKRVDLAIQKGVEYLMKGKTSPACLPYSPNSDELILLTLAHAGVPESDPYMQELLKRVLGTLKKGEINYNYNVALQAMVLEKLDRVRYQSRILECAQFLVDTQCLDGLWTYADTATSPQLVADVASVDKVKPAVSASDRRPKVVRKLKIKKTRDHTSSNGGDNSSAQYSALGLRACHDAGIVIPEETIRRAMKWWQDHTSGTDEGGADDKRVATGGGRVAPVGWCYHQRRGYPAAAKYGRAPNSTGAMTAGGVGSLAIYDYMLGLNWKTDPLVNGGLSWLGQNFTVMKNPGAELFGYPRDFCRYYYLYAMERAGILCGTDFMGAHAWYPEGAEAILKEQKADGSWDTNTFWDDLTPGGVGSMPVWDTCFAILFLKRATTPLVPVASVDRVKPADEKK